MFKVPTFDQQSLPMNITFLYRTIAGRAGLIFLLLTGVLSIGACREAPEAPTLMQEVIAIHDSVMPKMSEISRLVARLKPLADSTAQGQQYARAMKDLQEAHTAMMDWMNGFGERFDHAEIMKGKELSPQKQEWLLEEEVKVKVMAEKVNSSIANAKALLKNRE